MPWYLIEWVLSSRLTIKHIKVLLWLCWTYKSKEFDICGSWKKWLQVLPILICTFFFFEMWFYSPSHEDVKSISQHLALVSETITTMIQFSWVQLLSHDRLCNPMDCSMPGLPVHHHLPQFTQTHVHQVGDSIQPSHPLSSPSPLAFNISQHQGLFQWVSSSHQVAKVLAFQLQHHSFQWIFRTDFLYNGLVWSPCSPRDSQESSPTPQLKTSILWRSAFFIVQLSHPYMTTGKTIALTRQTFVGEVMSLLLNMLSRLVITFLPRSKHLLISWLQSPSAVILEPRKIKSDTVSTVSPSISHEVMGPDAMILVFWILSFKPTFSLSSFTFIKRLLSSLSLSAIRVCHLHIWGYSYFSRQSWFQLVLLPVQCFSWCTLHIS